MYSEFQDVTQRLQNTSNTGNNEQLLQDQTLLMREGRVIFVENTICERGEVLGTFDEKLKGYICDPETGAYPRLEDEIEAAESNDVFLETFLDFVEIHGLEDNMDVQAHGSALFLFVPEGIDEETVIDVMRMECGDKFTYTPLDAQEARNLLEAAQTKDFEGFDDDLADPVDTDPDFPLE